MSILNHYAFAVFCRNAAGTFAPTHVAESVGEAMELWYKMHKRYPRHTFVVGVKNKTGKWELA